MLVGSEEMEGRGGKGRGGGGGGVFTQHYAHRSLVKQRGGFNESLSVDGPTIGQHLASYTRVIYRLRQGGVHAGSGNPT